MLRGTKHVGSEAMDTIGHTAGAVIHHTAAVGGKLEHAATGLVEGAVESAKGIGVSAEDAAAHVCSLRDEFRKIQEDVPLSHTDT